MFLVVLVCLSVANNHYSKSYELIDALFAVEFNGDVW